MDLKLKGKVAIVTGAGSQIGYGKGIALFLAKEGCDIVATDIDLKGAKQTAAEVKALGRKAIALKADVSNRTEVDDMVKEALKAFGKIDILVNNAGTSNTPKPFMEMTKQDWDININVNLYGEMNVAQAVIPHMISRHYGRIVNVTGGQGLPFISVYGATKAGIVAFTRSLAAELAPLGIIVNSVLPGLAQTGLTRTSPPELIEKLTQSSPLKRISTVDDLAPVVAFLASDICSYMVGQQVRLDSSE